MYVSNKLLWGFMIFLLFLMKESLLGKITKTHKGWITNPIKLKAKIVLSYQKLSGVFLPSSSSEKFPSRQGCGFGRNAYDYLLDKWSEKKERNPYEVSRYVTFHPLHPFHLGLSFQNPVISKFHLFSIFSIRLLLMNCG